MTRRKKEQSAAEKRRRLMKGPGAADPEALSSEWVLRCLEEIETACKRRQNTAEVLVKSVEARPYGFGYEKLVEEFEEAADLTVETLAVDESLRPSKKFRRNEEKTVAGAMFSDDSRHYPETYDLIITIRW
jgi:hypothetical protein